jgi:hypothetical protein
MAAESKWYNGNSYNAVTKDEIEGLDDNAIGKLNAPKLGKLQSRITAINTDAGTNNAKKISGTIKEKITAAATAATKASAKSGPDAPPAPAAVAAALQTIEVHRKGTVKDVKANISLINEADTAIVYVVPVAAGGRRTRRGKSKRARHSRRR